VAHWATRLIGVLSAACPAELCVVVESAVKLDRETELAPDLVVVHLDDVAARSSRRRRCWWSRTNGLLA
jgi:hypothetical protein